MTSKEERFHESSMHWLEGFKAIKRVREAKGWTLAEVAKENGFSVEELQYIENGEIDLFTVDTFAMYVRALGGHVGYGYELEGEKYPFTPEI